MNAEMERIGRILVEAEGKVLRSHRGKKVIPDFSLWANFGRLLKMVRKQPLLQVNADQIICETKNIDQIPTLVATELAKIIEEGK